MCGGESADQVFVEGEVRGLWIGVICAALLCTAWANGLRAAECDVSLKPTDGYQELSAKLQCMAAEIERLKKVVFPKSKSPAAKPIVAAASQERDGVRIDVEKCSKSGPSIRCWLVITSIGRDRRLTFQSFEIFDDQAVFYEGRSFQGAGESRPQTRMYLHREFIADVPKQVELGFRSETEQPATSISRMKFQVDQNYFNFRQIALQ